MAFVYCQKCRWTQDDFWTWPRYIKKLRKVSMGHNPMMRTLVVLKDYTLPRGIKFDHQYIMSNGWPLKKNGKVHSWRVLKKKLTQIVKEAKAMKWKTWEDWVANENHVCPSCGSTDAWILD